MVLHNVLCYEHENQIDAKGVYKLMSNPENENFGEKPDVKDYVGIPEDGAKDTHPEAEVKENNSDETKAEENVPASNTEEDLKDLRKKKNKKDVRKALVIAITFAVIIILLLLLKQCGGNSGTLGNLLPGMNLDIDDTPFGDIELDEDAKDWNGELPTSGDVQEASSESIAIPGYGQLVLSEKTQKVSLINPNGNTVIMVYTLYKDDGNIYQTKGLAPGKVNECNLYELLGGVKGTYKVQFKIETYDVETFEPCNGATQDVEVIIK